MSKERLIHAFQTVRQQTESLCQPLTTEDYVIQSCEEVSPPKWHLAHSSWFFETFVLMQYRVNYQPFHSSYHHLFNSYYQRLGNAYPRAKRGLLSRPTVAEIYAYRNYIDTQLLTLLTQATEEQCNALSANLILGLQHEQQHQELLLMDIKHNFSINPSFPAYLSQNNSSLVSAPAKQTKTQFIEMNGGFVEIGYQGENFCFDNELPQHKKFLIPYAMATQLVTNGEYLEFIDAGGYCDPIWWLADGWDSVLKNNWKAPLYWQTQNNEWHLFTLNGLLPLNYAEPVSHLSYYEADAYARWRKARLPSEEEWEHFVVSHGLKPEKGNFLETGLFHPQSAIEEDTQAQHFFGNLWEWTSSPYSSYPGYTPLQGALGEYNGKFMANQMVLRGGCCATPQSHIRTSYRNFFQPDKRWQFCGIRLANHI